MTVKKEGKKRFQSREKKRLIFYSLIMFLPLLQFCIFYIYVNFNSFLMAFQKTDGLTYQTTFAGFENFEKAWETLVARPYLVENSLVLFALVTVFGISLALIFSFYLYKKYPASGLFKVILFLPKIIPSIVFAIIFNYMVSDAYPALVQKLTGVKPAGLFSASLASKWGSVLFYNVWISFGVNVILFTGAMSGIDESIVESAKLDGVNIVQEFCRITVPMIFPTLVTFIVVGLSGLFTHQASLYTLFGTSAQDVGTVGYYIYLNAKNSDLVAKSSYLSYHETAAMGLIFTFIIFPITMIVRKLLTRFGPRVD